MPDSTATTRSEPDRFVFNKTRLEAVTCEAGKDRTYVYDVKFPGLAFCVTSAGRRSYYLYKWHNGKPIRKQLGLYLNMAIDDARKAAGRKLVDLDKGEDIMDTSRKVGKNTTLAEAFAFFKTKPTRRKKTPRKARTTSEYDKQFNAHLACWKNTPISAITEQMVKNLRDTISPEVDGKPSKPYMANRVLALLSAIFEVARKHAGYRGENPTRNVDRFPEVSRTRYLSDDEIRRFMAALEAETHTTHRDALKVGLYTGARRSNVQAMAWAEVDFDANLWRIPVTKTGDALEIPLPPQAVEVLKNRKLKAQAGCPWVFASKRAACGHVVEMKSAMSRILDSAGIKDFRVHDLRHNLASILVNAGVSLEIIGRQLGHKSTATTAKYAHVDVRATRTAVDAAAARIDAVVGAKSNAAGKSIRSTVGKRGKTRRAKVRAV